MSPQPKTAEPKLTRAQKREAELEAAAKEATKDYKPKTGDVFTKSRDYVSAQFDIAMEIAERYGDILEERAGIRDDLRGLQRKGLLTTEEAVLLNVMFPVRTRDDDSNGGESAPAAA